MLVNVARNIQPISLEDVASGTCSLSYAEQVFAKLRKAGIVYGRRGPGGGYTLCKHPEEITVRDVVFAIETHLERRTDVGTVCIFERLTDLTLAEFVAKDMQMRCKKTA